MKDLKGNIQKNNMKKLVISAFLGMFCYCSNNAMEDPQPEIKNIEDVLTLMIKSQEAILIANAAIGEHKKNIYSTIVNEEGKIIRSQLIDFIAKHYTLKELQQEECLYRIEKLGQYFHLDEIEKEGECTEKNLTEIFWTAAEGGAKIVEPIKEIREYFDTIIKAEEARSIAFIKYYEIKKEKNKKAKEGVILKEIMNECCGEEEGKDIHQKFLANLEKLYKINPDNKNAILESIKRRITLNDEITEENFISFLKQKIEPLDEKDKDKIKEEEIVEGGCCPCCDCLENKKNKKVEVEESQHELE